MIGAGPAKPSLWVAEVVLALVLWVPTGVEGQDQLRMQVAGTGLFHGDAHGLFGYDAGMDIGGGDCRPGAFCEVPNYTFLAGAYAGVATSGVPGYAHIGVERKLTDQLGLGVLAFGFANPYQGGPALRLDGQDVGAIKMGYGWGDADEEDDGFFLALEIAFEFVRDLFR